MQNICSFLAGFIAKDLVFEKIQVLIPQVILRQKDGFEWSWDQQRWGKIRDKKTLGDAVLDGIFPEEKIPSHQSMLEQSLKALHNWIERAKRKLHKSLCLMLLIAIFHVNSFTSSFFKMVHCLTIRVRAIANAPNTKC